ncbi:MAG TPA: FHA domain-containing protein [Dissulfurispiraceae bacterium]|nr:FHA domain-containing protein [Dissulfurispiraceae bacterium]
MAKLVLKFKDAVLKEITIEKNHVMLGRKPENDLAIDNLAVSGFHAKILKDKDRYLLEDMGSLNGTYVNGVRVTNKELRHGDQILIGKHVIEFIAPELKPAEPEPQPSQRPKTMDETIVMDPRVQQQLLGRSSEPHSAAPPPGKPDLLGGFVVIEGKSDQKEYELHDRVTTVGKDSSAGIRLRGFFTPRVVALVNRRKEGYFISPAAKHKLPKVNGRDISERYDLKDGDVVEVPGLKLQFYVKG